MYSFLKRTTALLALVPIVLSLWACDSSLLSEPPAATIVEYAKKPSITGLTHQAATVGFHLTLSSFATLEYGTVTGNYTKSTPISSETKLEHSVVLSELTPSTQYFYRITAVLANGRQFRLSEERFTTAAAPSVTGLALASVPVFLSSSTTVGITWTTNLACTSQVEYGVVPGVYTASSVVTSISETNQTASISGLSPSTTYYFRLRHFDAGGGLLSSEYTYATTAASGVTPLTLATAPVFSSLTSTSMVVTWTTNLASTSVVEFGTTSGIYTGSTVLESSASTNHSATLTGLTAGTMYFVRLRNNGASMVLVTTEFSQTTNSEVALALSGPPVFTPTTTGMGITWNTNLAAVSQVEYGTTAGSYTTSTVLETTPTTNHNVSITGLSSGTTYYFRIRHNGTTSSLVTAEYTQATPAATALSLGGTPIFSGVTTTGMTVNWTTNLPTVSQVEYGTVSGTYGSSSVLETVAGLNHTTTISNLVPGTAYFLRLRNFGTTESLLTSEYTQSTTAATPLSMTSGPIFSSISTTGMTISWTTSLATTSQVEYGTSTGIYGASTVLESTPTTNHTAILSGLVPGTTYYLRLRNVTGANVLLSTESTQATTTATALALFSSPVFSPTTSSIGLSWTTNLSCTSLVEYGTTSGVYTNSTVVESSAATTHSATLTGLASGTTYYLRLRHFDSATGLTSTEYSQATTSVVPVVVGNPVVSATTTSITITWTSDLSATSQVEYGTVSGTYPSNTLLTGTASTSHSHTLTGLTQGVIYYYRIKMTNGAGTNTVTEASQSTEPSLTVKNRGIWLLGGISGSGIGSTVSTVDLFDPVTSTWYPAVTALPTPVSFAGYSALGGFLYVMGGFDSSGNVLASVQIYNIAAGTWDVGTVMPAPRANFQAATGLGRIFVTGGTTSNATIAWAAASTVYQYIPNGLGNSGTWSTKTAIAAVASERFAYVAGGTVFSIGGRSAAAAYTATVHDGLIADAGVSGVGALTTGITEIAMVTPRAGVSGATYLPTTDTGSVILVGGVSASTGTTGSFINQGTTAGTLSNLVQYLPEPFSAGAAWTVPVGGVTTYPSSVAFAAGVVSTMVSPARFYNFGGTSALTASAAGSTTAYYTNVPVLLANPNWVIPSWTSTTMPTARWGHGAVTLNQ